ncbi:MAG: SAM-dependent methyltransferase [Polyangiaceae bacterium]
MPSHLKERVRTRMEKTGESHQQALRQVRRQGPSDGGSDRNERMRTVSDTAFSMTVVRAAEGELPVAERLFEDPYATYFAAAGAHAAENTQRFLELPFFVDGIRLRTRFIDDVVREGLAAGLTQVVVLGAGFDARALRMREIVERHARVFEVDTAEQLSRKRRVLASAGVRLPAYDRYVPYEFGAVRDEAEAELALSAALAKKGFRSGAGAVFVWEGVIGYITDAEIDWTLRFMVKAGGPESRVAFTFGPWSFDPDGARARLMHLGFRACDELNGEELWRRYWTTEPHPAAHVMRIAAARV